MSCDTWFLIQSAFNRIVWHSHTFLPGWCRVVKWRGGLGFPILSVIMSKSLLFFGQGCLLYLQFLYPRVSRYWDGSQRANCVINNRGPMQREARWVFWGRELSLFPVLDWRHGNASWAARGRQRAPRCKHIDTQGEVGYRFSIITSIISIRKMCLFLGAFHSLVSTFEQLRSRIDSIHPSAAAAADVSLSKTHLNPPPAPGMLMWCCPRLKRAKTPREPKEPHVHPSPLVPVTVTKL